MCVCARVSHRPFREQGFLVRVSVCRYVVCCHLAALDVREAALVMFSPEGKAFLGQPILAPFQTCTAGQSEHLPAVAQAHHLTSHSWQATLRSPAVAQGTFAEKLYAQPAFVLELDVTYS